jgi:glutathione S-transferase
MAAPLRRRVDWEMDLNLRFIDQSLSDRPYLLGDDLTAADIQMGFVGELAAANANISDTQISTGG